MDIAGVDIKGQRMTIYKGIFYCGSLANFVSQILSLKYNNDPILIWTQCNASCWLHACIQCQIQYQKKVRQRKRILHKTNRSPFTRPEITAVQWRNVTVCLWKKTYTEIRITTTLSSFVRCSAQNLWARYSKVNRCPVLHCPVLQFPPSHISMLLHLC